MALIHFDKKEKVGKNNPKATEIEADNAARQDWNRTADMALVSGIAESKIIQIRNEHVYNRHLNHEKRRC